MTLGADGKIGPSLSIPSLRLYALSLRKARWSALQRALCNNAAELLPIAGIVLLLYVLALGWFHTQPLTDMTLERLQAWDRTVHETHEWLEEHQLHWLALFLISGALLILRIASSVRPTLARAASTTSMLVAGGIRWTGRLATALAIAATLTFLGTHNDGPTASIRLTIRDAKNVYNQLQSTLTAHVDALLRHELLRQAWTQRPPILKAAMTESAKFQQLRREYEEAVRKAKAKFAIDQVDLLSSPRSIALPKPGTSDSNIASDAGPSWSLDRLRTALEKARDLHVPVIDREQQEQQDASDEIAQGALEDLLPTQRLFETASVGDLIKTHYPVFGEFIDVINSAVTETAFESMRDFIVRRMTAKAEAHGTDDAETIATSEAVATSEADAAARTIRFDWSPFNGDWQRAMRAKLDAYSQELASSRAYLEKAAANAQSNRMKDSRRMARAEQVLLSTIGRATADARLVDAAANVERLANRLTDVAEKWPPLSEASASQAAELAHMAQDARKTLPDYGAIFWPAANSASGTAHQNLFDEDPESSTPESARSLSRRRSSILGIESPPPTAEHPSARWGTDPLEAMAFLRSYCDERILAAEIGAAPPPDTQRRLQEAMGDRYQEFLGLWNARRANQKRIDAWNAAEVEKARGPRAPGQGEHDRIENYTHPVEIRGR